MAVLSKGDLFDPILVNEVINNVRGKSAFAALSGQVPVPFTGQKEFVFTMGSEANLVAENGAKSAGTAALSAVTIVPVKIEYGARVSDEFMYASEENRVDVLRSFNEGFAAKAARALDIMALHGMNPRTATVAELLGTNYLDVGTQAAYEGASGSEVDANELVETAIGMVGANDYDVSGIMMAPAFRTKLSKLTMGDDNRQPLFPELRWGGAPGAINGLPAQVNSTVAFGSSADYAAVGDFANAFRWGYAKEIPLEVIPYGNPDNSDDGDLKGHNQVYLRCELYLGWGILDKGAFALIRSGSAS